MDTLFSRRFNALGTPTQKEVDKSPVLIVESQLTVDCIYSMVRIRVYQDNKMVEINSRIDGGHQSHRSTRIERIGIWEWDLVTDAVYYSPAWKRVRGFDAEEILRTADQATQFVHPDDRAKRKKLLGRLRAGELEQVEFEHRVKRSDGSWGRVVERTHAICNDEGQPIRLVGCEVDVSADEQEERLPEVSSPSAPQVDSLPIAVARFEGNDCVYVNEYWSEQTGLQFDAALGSGWMERIHPDDLKMLQEKMAAFATDPKQIAQDAYEARQVLPDGSTRWVQCHLAKEHDAAGNVAGYVGTLNNIDRVKRAEEDLKELNRRLHKVLESSSIGIWEWHWADERLAWDDKMHEIYGVDVNDFRGIYSDWSERIHPADLDRITAEDQCRAESSQQFAQEFRIVRPDGKVRHIYSNAYTELDEHGKPVRATGVNVDITERREAEFALLESEHKLQRIADHLPGIVYRYFLDLDGNSGWSYLSSQVRELFGIEPSELMETKDLLWQLIDPDDMVRLRERMEVSAKDLSRFMEEFRVTIPDRETRWFQANSQPSKTKNGGVEWDGVILDITDRKEVELANDVLAKATKTKDEFLANMSHELRTPLTAILAMTDGLQQGMFGETTPKQMESLKIVEQSGVHLLDLINEVLDLAKIESGQTELEFSNIDVSELCQSCLNLVSQQAEQKQIKLSLGVPWNLPRLGADEKRIRQVLINLLSNAVKFTPHGGQVKLEIETLAAATGPASETLRISISDTGIGIQNDQLDSLFEPFVQADSSLTRKYGGTGLGLSLVKQFVELHQGKVHVTSEPGQGSCFIVVLPFRKTKLEHPDLAERSTYREQEFDTGNSDAEPKNISTTPPEVDGDYQPLILLAEDNDLVAQSIIPILEFHKFRVMRAVNGRLAVEMARKHSPDLILMDVQMPEMDGLEATRYIRAIDELSKLPIIAVSGFAKLEDSRRCIEAGMDLFMAKPLRIKELVGSINNLLNAQKSTSPAGNPASSTSASIKR